MHTDHIGNYHRARTIAQCFAQTANLLHNTTLKERPRQNPLLIVPFVVNASFACELFLKALAHRGGVSLQGYSLSKLLAAIPVKERHCLDEAWTAVAYDVNGDVAESLASVVNDLSNSFVEWRYSHEKERVSTASSSAILLLLEVLDNSSKYRHEV